MGRNFYTTRLAVAVSQLTWWPNDPQQLHHPNGRPESHRLLAKLQGAARLKRSKALAHLRLPDTWCWAQTSERPFKQCLSLAAYRTFELSASGSNNPQLLAKQWPAVEQMRLTILASHSSQKNCPSWKQMKWNGYDTKMTDAKCLSLLRSPKGSNTEGFWTSPQSISWPSIENCKQRCPLSPIHSRSSPFAGSRFWGA